MRIFYCDHFVLPLPEGHRFPMSKYARLRERIVADHVVPAESLRVPEAATETQLLRIHTPEYVRKVLEGALSPAEVRRIGFPWSPALVERSRRSVGGTIEACRAALEEGVALNLAGGTHHAFADHGEGFCVFNDAAVAAREALSSGWVRRVAVLDCDVHQGNGTATIFARDSSVFTLSIHARRNYPFEKACSDLDMQLEDGAGDAEYLDVVERGVSEALARSNAELAIYVSGADPLRQDRLGRLAVGKEALAERDRRVLSLCAEAGAAVAVTMAGGYAADVEDTVDVHTATVRAAAAASRGREGRARLRA